MDEAVTPRVLLCLGHGAGGGVDARDLVALARALPAEGVTVVRVEQPWRVAGRRVAPAPARLDEGWLAALTVHAVPGVPIGGAPSDVPLIVGGRSAGARVACRTATALGARAVLALAFPLHPPGRPERSRAAELAGAGVPVLVVQGERDPFGTPEEVRAAAGARPDASGVEVVAVPGADHGMAVPKRGPVSQEDALAAVVRAASDLVVRTAPRGRRKARG